MSMSRRVWKFKLEVKKGNQFIAVPSGGKTLCAAFVREIAKDQLRVWIEVDEDRMQTEKIFFVVATNEIFLDGNVAHSNKYISTCFHSSGEIYHVYEKEIVQS